MPIQRKNRDTVTISPVVDRVLYSAAIERGYNMREVFNLALAALLEIDDENQIRYDVLRDMKAKLTTHDYKEMIERVKHQQEEKSHEQAKEAAVKESKIQLLDIIITKCRPKPNYLSSIKNSLEEGIETSMLSDLQNTVSIEAKAAGLEVDDVDILSGIREAVRRDWKTED